MMINSLFYGLEQSRRLLGISAIPELTFGIAELTYRILLRKAGKARIAIMVDSPYHMYDQTRFSITEAVAIHPRFSKRITSLRTAVENGEGSLDKAATSHDDLLDAFRPSLMFWY
jgi:hypothetical protein